MRKLVLRWLGLDQVETRLKVLREMIEQRGISSFPARVSPNSPLVAEKTENVGSGDEVPTNPRNSNVLYFNPHTGRH